MVGPPPGHIETGLPGLDELLDGGLLPGRAYMLRGGPGRGKTILAFHFLTTGSQPGDEDLQFIGDETFELELTDHGRRIAVTTFLGEVRKTIGILKKRLSGFESTLREHRIDGAGSWIGDPLATMRGILTGTPEWVGNRDDNHE